jgi:iron complex outermembrane receptor protein
MTEKSKLRSGAAMKFALGLVGGALAFTPAAMAQETDEQGPRGAASVASDEIVVTATKRGDVLAQDVPGAITAFGAEQLEALNFQSLQSLTYVMPNVQLEDVGTAPGVANFGIRGLAINSSIPSVDPTVGVFVDGVYQGINAGIVVDNFDLEGVEVLRGPQGTLYGRNVTGGAVLIRTTAPGDDLEINARAGIETGPEYTADFSISGPLAEGLLAAKLAVYHNEDEGWFENDFDGSQFGASEMDIYRFALRATPTNNLDLILRLEQGFSDSDGPAAQNHGLYESGSFDFAINNPGYASGDWNQATFEVNWDVPLGDGTITNIAGWRDYDGRSSSDIDATSFTGFHARAVNEQDQWSNELRYAGTFGNVELTTGVYHFEQNLFYIEERFLFAGLLPLVGPLQYADDDPFWITRVGGGEGEFSTWAAFANADWHLSDELTVNFGVRYSHEEKSGQISRIRRGVTAVTQPITVAPIPALVGQFILPADNLDGTNVIPGEGVVGGSIDGGFLTFSDAPFDLSWNDTSPRVGIQWEPNEETNIYAFWAQGFRSGGMNFRVTTLGTTLVTGAPTPFDAEEQSSFEVGWKQDFADRRGRINLALFHNTIDDMQRETNVPDATGSGVQQVIVNAGTAIIQGAELEARWSFTENFLVSVQAGYTDGEYDEVTADLDSLQVDCVTPSVLGMAPALTVGACDLDQEIPRLAPWTYGANVVYDLPILGGMLSSRVGYNHRDEAFYNDSNRGFLAEADIFDANLTFTPDNGNWSLSVYGENLTDEATWGGDTNLPDAAPFGGDGTGGYGTGGPANPTFSPLNEGMVIGAALRLHN